VGTHLATVAKQHLTKEQAGQPLTLGDVWSEDLQRFIPLGQQVALDRERREADPAYQLTLYEKQRSAILNFVATKLTECEYDAKGYPLPGKMHDYYILPGYKAKTATKACVSKVLNLLRLRVAKRRVTNSNFTADHGSARVMVELVDSAGQPAGAYEAACSTAEAAFQSDGVRKKYGARYERVKGEYTEVSPPDFRAAENDIVARAGKRATTGATIVAASLEEIFDLESSTGAAGDETRDQDEQQHEEAPQKAAPAPEKGEPTIQGKPVSECTTAELENAQKALNKMPDDARYDRLRLAVAQTLHRRLVDGGDANLSLGMDEAPSPTGRGPAPRRPASPRDDDDDPVCPECGGEMWDNRQDKRNPKSPDFRCKNKVCGADKGVIWPEKEA
jgi:hypothetical protein